MYKIPDLDHNVKTTLEINPDGDSGTVLISMVYGNTVKINAQDLLRCLKPEPQAQPDMFIAVEYDSKLDSYIPCCSGETFDTSAEAIREYKSWGHCGFATIARRHKGRWYIGDIDSVQLVYLP